MTIAVKIILSPIMYKQHKLSAMMRVIRPEIEEAQEKYKNADPMKKQQATMEVYRKLVLISLQDVSRAWYRFRSSMPCSDSSRICWICEVRVSGLQMTLLHMMT